MFLTGEVIPCCKPWLASMYVGIILCLDVNNGSCSKGGNVYGTQTLENKHSLAYLGWPLFWKQPFHQAIPWMENLDVWYEAAGENPVRSLFGPQIGEWCCRMRFISDLSPYPVSMTCRLYPLHQDITKALSNCLACPQEAIYFLLCNTYVKRG